MPPIARQDALATRLPALARLNGATLDNVRILGSEKDQGGFGIVAEKHFDEHEDEVTLLSVPEDLLLSHTTVTEYARMDKHFMNLLGALASRQVGKPKHQMLLFLLYHQLLSSSEKRAGVANFWTEYMSVLPRTVNLPTQYTLEQRQMLIGTSLQYTLDAKLVDLERQHDQILEVIQDLSSGPDKLWFESVDVPLEDWIHVDALFRSRSLDIPGIGESMAPFIDMANHSRSPSARYDRGPGSSDVVLKLVSEVATGEEITICYGTEKSAAEMLFSYGFIDETQDTTSLVLDLRVDDDDPLGKAKLVAFDGRPSVKLYYTTNGDVAFDSPFLYFVMLNEEDGLSFRMTQLVDGTAGELRTFFENVDVSNKVDKFNELASDHPLKDLLELRCVVYLADQILDRMSLLRDSSESALRTSQTNESQNIGHFAMRLRTLETRLLLTAHQKLSEETQRLSESPRVQAYLSGMADDHNDGIEPVNESDTEEDDYS